MDLELEYGGKVIPLFTYPQLEGLSLHALKARAAQLRETIDADYELPPRTAHTANELIRYILCIQAHVYCDLEGIDDILGVTRKRFMAPSHVIVAENTRPTTPPRRRTHMRYQQEGDAGYEHRRESSPSSFSRKSGMSQRMCASQDKDGDNGPTSPISVNSTALRELATRPATSLEVTIQGRKLPLYSYEQLQYLSHQTLLTRVRQMEDVVKRVWDMPKAASHRSEDLLIYLLCIQAQLVAFQSEDQLDPRDVLVNGFGAPHEWGEFTETRHDMRASFRTQRHHFNDKYGDHIDGSLTVKKGCAQEDVPEGKQHTYSAADSNGVDPFRLAQADHLRGDITSAMDHSDTTMEGNLPRCVGRGKHHIAQRADFDEPVQPINTHRHDIVPHDHMRSAGVVTEFDGKRDDEVARGHGRKRLDSFIGGNQRIGGRILLSGSNQKN